MINWKYTFIYFALALGIAITIVLEITILQAYFSPVKWEVILSFNSINEGMVEMFLIPLVLAIQIIAIGVMLTLLRNKK